MKDFNTWWEWWNNLYERGPKTKRELAEIAWHAGQAAVDVVKIYHKGKGTPPEIHIEDE